MHLQLHVLRPFNGQRGVVTQSQQDLKVFDSKISRTQLALLTVHEAVRTPYMGDF